MRHYFYYVDPQMRRICRFLGEYGCSNHAFTACAFIASTMQRTCCHGIPCKAGALVRKIARLHARPTEFGYRVTEGLPNPSALYYQTRFFGGFGSLSFIPWHPLVDEVPHMHEDIMLLVGRRVARTTTDCEGLFNGKLTIEH